MVIKLLLKKMPELEVVLGMFETFAHKADIGIRGKGQTIQEAFMECAKALASVMANVRLIEPKKSHVINSKAKDLESLLISFLSELLFMKDSKKMLYSKYRVMVKEIPVASGALKEFELKAVCFGEKIDPKKHELMTDVKAATYTELSVKKEDGQWIAQCIVDV